jgi:hypothetical protein
MGHRQVNTMRLPLNSIYRRLANNRINTLNNLGNLILHRVKCLQDRMRQVMHSQDTLCLKITRNNQDTPRHRMEACMDHQRMPFRQCMPNHNNFHRLRT